MTADGTTMPDVAALAAREVAADGGVPASARRGEADVSPGAGAWLHTVPAGETPAVRGFEHAAALASADRHTPWRSRLDRAILATGGTTVAGPPVPMPAGRAGQTEPSAAAPGDPLPAGHAAAQVVRAVLLMWRDGVGEARVRLEPESLGTLTVVLRVERGVVTATVSSDVAAVRESIQAHERDLRASLAEHGLDLDRLVVTDDRPGGKGSPGQDARGWRAPRRGRAQAGPRFEIDA